MHQNEEAIEATPEIGAVSGSDKKPDWLHDLVRQARHLGASHTAIVSTTDIVVHDHLADLC